MNEGFKDREKGYEAKYQHDQEMLFKITARRNKLLGLWAAEQMGLNEEAAQKCALESGRLIDEYAKKLPTHPWHHLPPMRR